MKSAITHSTGKGSLTATLKSDVHFLFSREKRGIEEFDGEKFLTRKTDREKRGIHSLK